MSSQTQASTSTKSFADTFAFVPIQTTQKNIFNVQSLSSKFEALRTELKLKIENSEEVDADSVDAMLMQSIEKVYILQAEQEAAEGKKKKRKSSEKKAFTAYMFFSIKNRERVASENADMKFTDVGKRMGELWKAMSEDEKKPYREMQAQMEKEIKEGTYVQPEKKVKKAKIDEEEELPSSQASTSSTAAPSKSTKAPKETTKEAPKEASKAAPAPTADKGEKAKKAKK